MPSPNGAGPTAAAPPAPVFDCSGLIRAAYATVGVDLPHYSVTQANRGRAIDWRTEPIRAGDLSSCAATRR